MGSSPTVATILEYGLRYSDIVWTDYGEGRYEFLDYPFLIVVSEVSRMSGRVGYGWSVFDGSTNRKVHCSKSYSTFSSAARVGFSVYQRLKTGRVNFDG